MKQAVRKGFLFAGRSVVWSLLLYVAMMLVFNWEDVSKAISGKNAVTIVSRILPSPAETANAPASISAGSDRSALLLLLGAMERILLR